MHSPTQHVNDLITVVLVDDSPLFLAGLTNWLQREPDIQVVATATSASEGFTAIVEQRPQVAVIDLRLRHDAADIDSRLKTGVELLRQVQRATTTLTLVISSYHHPAWVRAAAQAGAYGFFDKDTSPQTLCIAIRQLATQKLPLWTPQQQAWLLASLNDSPTPRELEILQLVAKGLSDRAIAERLGLRPKTVSKHLEILREKLGVRSRAEAILQARQRGWLPPEWEDNI
jgi:DNA-binding NarL/FixJ family response regulator